MSDILFQPLGRPIALGEGLGRTTDIDPRLTRSHYFDGRLLTAEDLTRDQIYLDQRLREVGRVLGSGIVSGLELRLDEQRFLRVKPGLAITPAGRMLELGQGGLVPRSDGVLEPMGLSVDLGNRAEVAGLNDGQFRHYPRGLYAVVLQYVEVGTDIAEVFPRDLGAQRGAQFALITEAVQLGLVALPTALTEPSPLAVRARLMREFLGNRQLQGLLPEDSVALGVLAIQDDSPQWLDAELLRQPLREELLPGDLQGDLARVYEGLLKDILAWRAGGQQSGDFLATDYFSLLPPVGSVPKDALDPVQGRQGYFPEHYRVDIAPVRRADLDLILAESMSLPPLDLRNGEPVDIVVLAPLSNQDYGYFASPLERAADVTARRLPQLDPLRLKLYPVQPVHALPGDKTAWQAIWDRLGSTAPVYVRRPMRPAETGLSAVVLALGMGLPSAPPVTAVPGPSDAGSPAADEAEIVLRRVNLKTLANTRPPATDEGKKAYEGLLENYVADVDITLLVLHLLLRIERAHDDLVWQTLFEAAKAGRLRDFAEGVALQNFGPDTPTGKILVELGNRIGLSPERIQDWEETLR